MNILFISSEIADLMKSGGLADVAKALPCQLKENGHDVRLVMPCYSLIKGAYDLPIIGTGCINEGSPDNKMEFAIRQTFVGEQKVEVWLIDYRDFYDRTSMYGDNNQAYGDNGSRFAFLAAAALDAAYRMEFRPDIVHSNDWHAALAPMLIRFKYGSNPFFDKTRSVITIHNGAFQGVFDRGQISFLPEIASYYNDMIMQGSYINFLKCGVFFADKINTVSPGYAAELITYLGGHGMAKNFQDRAQDLCGIINGCDYSDWDPATDKHLKINYDLKTMEEKILGKYLLQRKLGLPMGDDPLYGMVARLTDQKGVGLLLPILDRFLQHKVQVVIEGTGDPNFERQMRELAARYPDKMRFEPVYNNELAHQIEAGADFFLMPSIFEPCGLNQIYSLAYATLPIVRAVGGLKDTVTAYDTDKEHGNGFMFYDPNPEELLSLLRRTLIFYLEDPDEMRRIKQNAMRTRFLWKDSCVKYEELYREALKKPKWW
ncbi:MAG: glycogen synthase GlgA [Candidatus Anaerobiospirillum merdipullorum]|uniref:Glycogen synthase n=1 Tax=Candidatus Anaerobiospirillum merdipullorum TaxID=2838450 RepID=A0A9E2KMS1_9GAMM|nr:glycogen synthase GlgA [Candidatus Anaerobiospirillum merdipullorum]